MTETCFEIHFVKFLYTIYSQHLHSSTSHKVVWYKVKSTLEGENVFVDEIFNNAIEDNQSQTMLEGWKQFPLSYIWYLLQISPWILGPRLRRIFVKLLVVYDN